MDKIMEIFQLVLSIKSTPTRAITFRYCNRTKDIAVHVHSKNGSLTQSYFCCEEHPGQFSISYDEMLEKLSDLKKDMEQENENK